MTPDPLEPTRAKDYRWVFLALVFGMILLDQVVKAWARHTFGDNLAALGGKPLPGIFEFTLTYNKGIAFGMFQGKGVLLAPVALFMAFVAAYYSFKVPRGHIGIHVSMGLLAAGALGNLFDRVFEGRVTDLFYFRLINFPVFNIADACITVSAVMLMILWTQESLHAKQKSEVAPAAAPAVVPAVVPSTTTPSSEG